MRLKKSISAVSKVTLWACILLIVIAVFAPILANHKPLLAYKNASIYVPIFNKAWQEEDYSWQLNAPIPYSPNSIDVDNSQSVGPFSKQTVKYWYQRHWLGTDELGRDVLSGLIHGSRIALIIGLGAMLLASIIGISLGASAAYFGDYRLRTNYLTIISILPIGFISWFYSFHQFSFQLQHPTQLLSIFLSFLLFLLIFSVLFFIIQRLSVVFKLKNSIRIPLDFIINRIIELFKSVPTLFIIISLAAILQPSIWNLVWIIGLFTWPNLARYCRAEVLKVKTNSFIESAHALGYSNRRVVLKHLLPSALQSTIIYITFGVAAAILAESTLSFMGIGMAAESVNWGSILAEARKNPSSWWLAVFPGLAIFVTLYLFNHLAKQLENSNRGRDMKF